MPYINIGKRNQLIWDGTDDGIIKNLYKSKCPHCNYVIEYSIKDITGIESAEGGLLAHLLNTKIISKVPSGYELKKGIPAYLINHCCQHCKNIFWITVGLKEMQPQRYNIYYKSVVYNAGEKVHSGI